jgi:arylsulfatase
LANKPKLSAAEMGAMRADYAGNLTLIDDQIGHLLQAVEQRGELDNTVIVLVSDHGEMNGDCGLIYKQNFLNGAVRVPLLVRTPDTLRSARAGQVCQAPVEWFDVGPTLVELAGGRIEHPSFAYSLMPLVNDPDATIRPEAISELGGEIMLLNREWKAALNTAGQVYLLFDVVNDAQEQENLAGLAQMRKVETALRLRILERLVQSQLGV